jgi:hypothetical protein
LVKLDDGRHEDDETEDEQRTPFVIKSMYVH